MGVQRWRGRVPAALLRRAAGVLVIAAGLAAGTAVGARADLFDRIYAEGQQKNGDIRTLTASFVETTSSELLTRPLVASGTVAVERPSRIALTYTHPDSRRVLIDGDRLTVTWPSKQVHEEKDIGAAQKRIQKYFVDSSPSELRSHFTVTASETSDRPGTYLVTMVPKRKQIREGLTKLELWIARSTLLMDAMRITFPNGDTKLMTFTDVKVNAPIDAAAFAASRP
jgi:outer membrane lipoprotein-sorting protein